MVNIVCFDIILNEMTKTYYLIIKNDICISLLGPLGHILCANVMYHVISIYGAINLFLHINRIYFDPWN